MLESRREEGTLWSNVEGGQAVMCQLLLLPRDLSTKCLASCRTAMVLEPVCGAFTSSSRFLGAVVIIFVRFF